MLKVGSTFAIYDNSGALSAKILNIKNKPVKKSVATLFNLVYAVITDHKIMRKKNSLVSKKFVNSLILGTKKTISRKNGIFFKFSVNFGLPLKITRFVVPVGTWVLSPVVYEIKYFKKYKVLKAKSSGIY